MSHVSFSLPPISYFILHPRMIYVLYFNIIQAFRASSVNWDDNERAVAGDFDE